MSLILMESADVDNEDELVGEKWTTNNTVTFEVKGGRNSFNIGARQDQGIMKRFEAQQDSTIIVGWRFYAGAGADSGNKQENQILGFWSGNTEHVRLKQAGNNRFRFQAVEGGANYYTANDTHSPNTWQYLEAKVTIDYSGSLELRVDGNTVISQSGVDIRNSAAVDNNVDEVAFGAQRDLENWIRDIVIMNSAGSALNDFQGPVIVELIQPDGAGNYSQWTPNSGSNWAAVDENTPDGDSTYVLATSTALRDSYTFSNIQSITQNPLAVQVWNHARYKDAPLDVASFVRRGVTDSDGSFTTPSGGYQTRAVTIWEDDPIAGSNWTVSNVNNSEFGVRT